MSEDIKIIGNETAPKVDQSQLKTSYANVSRIAPTPNEIIIDFGMNPNAFGHVLDEGLRLESRVILSPDAAKRLCIYLTQTIQQYEARYGSIELDLQKRMRGSSVAAGQAPVS